ncbi:TPA: magnesium transporter CorA family protein, partial [Enterococcus faecium]
MYSNSLSVIIKETGNRRKIMIKYFTLDNEKLRNTGKETDQTI